MLALLSLFYLEHFILNTEQFIILHVYAKDLFVTFLINEAGKGARTNVTLIIHKVSADTKHHKITFFNTNNLLSPGLV